MRPYSWPAQIARELRQALRRLYVAPFFALFSIATLALAIGVTTAAYSVVHRMMDEDLGVRDMDQLVGVYQHGRAGAALSWDDYHDVVAQQRTFGEMAAWSRLPTSVGTADAATLAVGEITTGSYFEILRATAKLGRLFTPDDDRPDASPVIVLSDSLWRLAFHADPDVVGKTIMVGGRWFTVIGVTAVDFRGLSGRDFSIGFWVPMAFAPALTGGLGLTSFDPKTTRERGLLHVVGRLQPAFSVEHATEDLRLIGRRLNDEYPPPPGNAATAQFRVRNWTAGPAVPARTISTQGPLLIILGLPALVLLVACTNLANLTLSRGVARRNSISVKHALGASRWRLVREEMSEAAIVAVLGGLAGMGIARWLLARGLGLIRDHTSVPAYALHLDLALSPAVFVPIAGATLLSIVVGGLLPALQLSRVNIRQALANDSAASLRRWRGRGNLIALQVSASVGLFLLAFAGSSALPSILSHDGPRLDGVAVAAIPFRHQQYSEARARDTVDRVLAELRRTPGVRSVAAGGDVWESTIVLRSFNRAWGVTTADRPFTETNTGIWPSLTIGTPDIFEVLALPFVEGRAFSDADTAGRGEVAVIDENLARDLFGPTASAVGRTLLVRLQTAGFNYDTRDITMTIVGVVPGRETSRSGNRRRHLYLPFAQYYDPNVAVLVRADTDTPPVVPLQTVLRRVAPGLATAFLGDGALLTDTPNRIAGAVTLVAHGLAAFALVLAMAGLYGVLSHVVSLRTRELAVRSALGASATRIVRMVLRDGLRPVVEGMFIGLGAAMVIRQILRATVVDDLSAIDPVAFGVAVLLLVTAGLVACYLPARRASRVDPNVALRDS